jgi:hypothetical protein
MSAYETTERPSVVTAASVLLYIFAGISGLAGLLLLGAGAMATGPGMLLTLVMLGLAVLYLVFATMILKGSNGARIATIVFLSISIVLDLVGFDKSSLISIGLALLIIGLLAWNRDAQAYFGATGVTYRGRYRAQK